MTCLRAYQPVEGFQAYAAAIAEPALAVGTFVELHTSQRQPHWVSTAKRATIPYCERGVLGTLRYKIAMDKVMRMEMALRYGCNPHQIPARLLMPEDAVP